MADPIAEDVPYRAVKDTAAGDADDELDIVEQRLDQAEKRWAPCYSNNVYVYCVHICAQLSNYL